MPKLSPETIEQVTSATDIVDLIGAYIPVQRAGSRFKALCPFHNEKTPSFSIDPARQYFHCFGCKKSGDVISFVREIEGLSFIDSVRKLAERAGIPIVEQALDPREEADRQRRGKLLDLLRRVARYYHALLLEAPAASHARDYLKSRGFSRQTAEKWQIGWAPPQSDFTRWAREESLQGRDLADIGILKKTERGVYFYFRNRLMFPICNDYGDVIGFSGRQLDDNPREGKYVNSPETRLFKKSNVLFGLDKARKSILDEKTVLICEGQVDAITCHEHGLTHAIAPLGTAFPEQHAITLRRYTRSALLCYDADTAGHKAVEKAFLALAQGGLGVRVVAMPPGLDPDSMIQTQGVDAFRAQVDQAGTFLDFKLRLAGDLSDPLKKAAFIQETAPLLAAVADPIARDTLVQHLATRTRVGVAEIQSALRRRRPSPRPHRGEPDASPQPVVTASPLDRSIATLCTLALHSTAARDWLGEQFETLHELQGHLDGIHLLQAILSSRPDPESTAAINRFLSDLPEPDRLALIEAGDFEASLPPDPVGAADQTLAAASALALEKEDGQIKAALNDPQLDSAEAAKLFARMKEIAELLVSLPSRALTTDQFSPRRRHPAARTNPWKKDFSPKRKS